MRERTLCSIVRGARRSAFAALLVAAATSCADLAPLGDDKVCGNAVIDPGEDCDEFADAPGELCAKHGTAHECRYVCSIVNGMRASCPLGSGCGADEVCRRASGAFTQLGETVPFPSLRQLQVSDLDGDGDGADEILALSDVDAAGRRFARVVYPPRDGQKARVEALSALVAMPALGRLDTDSTADIAFADLDGVSVLRGRSGGPPEAAAFPSLLSGEGTLLRALPIDVLTADADKIVIYSADAETSSAKITGYDDIHKEGVRLATLAAKPDDIAGDIVWGRLDEGPACPEIVFPQRGAPVLTIVTPCRLAQGEATWNEDAKPREIALAPGATITDGVRLVDLDLDGHLDLLVGAASAGADVILAAWGRGDGTFTSAPAGGGTEGTAGIYELPAIVKSARLPLAVADLNNDKMEDFVVAEGVFISHPGGYTSAYENGGGVWDVAMVADLNANGLPDVVAGSSHALNLDFLNNAGGGVLNPSVVVTTGLPSHLSAGDFDGDLIADLAYAERIEATRSTIDQVTIAFGSPYGPPTVANVVAHLKTIKQLYPAHLPAQGPQISETSTDGLSDLVIVSEYTIVSEYGDRDVDIPFMLRGTGSRGVTASLPLQNATLSTSSLPLGLAIGHFDGDAMSLAALGGTDHSKLRLWHIDDIEGLTQSRLVVSDPLEIVPAVRPGGGKPHFDLRYGAVMAAGDIDGDNIDEVVMAVPAMPSATLVIAKYDPATSKFKAAELLLPPAVSLSTDSALALVDIDGDGHRDALLSTGIEGTPGDTLVLWNDGRGSLDVGAPTKLSPPGRGFSGFTCLPSSTRAGCDPLLISRSGTYLAEGGGARAFTLVQRDRDDGDGLPGGNAIVSGDFDRDGVPDFAIGNADGLRFFRSTPVRE